MTKDELKVGYVLELEIADEGTSFVMVLPSITEELIISGPNTWFPLGCFNDNLEYMGCKVLRVFGYSYNAQAYLLSTTGRELLWERPTAKKLTMKQIEKLLGYPVELVEEEDELGEL